MNDKFEGVVERIGYVPARGAAAGHHVLLLEGSDALVKLETERVYDDLTREILALTVPGDQVTIIVRDKTPKVKNHTLNDRIKGFA